MIFASKFAAYAREVGWRRAAGEWLRSLFWIWAHQATNRWWDLRAVAAGYCNHRPWSPIPGDGGGYSHWRCARRRGHAELHRSRNYVWNDAGRTEYAPIPISERLPSQPWDRNMTPTWRQSRAQRRWHAEQSAARARARAA